MIITLSLFFITASFAQLIKPSKENDEHIQYYNSIKKTVLNKGKLEWNKIDYRRLRFGGMLYSIEMEINALRNGNGFLEGEKEGLKAKIAAGNTSEAMLLAKTILDEEITYLPALKYYSQSNDIDKKEKAIYQGLFTQVESSLLKSGDGKSIQTAYEILNPDEEEYLMQNRCGSFGMEAVKENGREFNKVNCLNTKADNLSTYFDITAISAKKLAPVGTSFTNEFEMQKQQLDNMFKGFSARSQVYEKSFIPQKTKSVADSMAAQFINFYKAGKWDLLWERYKEKSKYYNANEQFEKNKFLAFVRSIYDSCGTFKNAELSSFNMFKFGMSSSKGLEYQYKAKYEKCDRILFLEIWTVEDSVTNFRHFGFSRRKDN